jgi:hypothetical protein
LTFLGIVASITRNYGLHGKPSPIQNEKDLTFLVHMITFTRSQDFLF